MADAPVDLEVLTPANAIPRMITPTGRQFGVKLVNGGLMLYEVAFVDGKPGEIPVALQGRWTKEELAAEAVNSLLKKLWQASEEQRVRLAQKAGRAKLNEVLTSAESESANAGS